LESPVAPGGGVGGVGEDHRAGHAAGLRDGALQRDELALHPVAPWPELMGQLERLGLGQRAIPISGHDHLRTQLGHIGERVADHDAGRHGGALQLHAPGFADQFAVTAGLGDEFVAAHQRRDHDPGDGRPGLLGQQPVQDVGGTLAGGGEVHMRVGVVDRHAVDLAQHAVGHDAVQVERDHERLVRPEDLARLGEQVPLGVEFTVGRHGAVHREIHALDAGGRLARDGFEHLGREFLPARSRQQTGGSGTRTDRQHRIEPGLAEHAKRAAERGVQTLLRTHLLAALDMEVVVARLQRVEGRDLLHAFGNQDAMVFHGVFLGVRG